MPDYTESDLKALQGLMVFGKPVPDAGPMTESRQQALPVNYARSDISQFDALMKFGTLPAQVATDLKQWGPEPTTRPMPNGGAYTVADLRQFDRLLSPLPGGSGSLSAFQPDDANSPLLDGDQSYTAQDLAAFRRLMEYSPDAAAEPGAASPSRAEPLQARPQLRGAAPLPRAVKIVDADKERNKERNGRQNGRMAIKIVYSSAGGGAP